MPGPFEFFVVALLILLFFGHRLPIVGRALGRSVSEFKEGLDGDEPAQVDEQSPPPRPKALQYTPDDETVSR